MFCNKPKSANRSVPGKKNRKRKKKPTHTKVENKFKKTHQSHINVAQAMTTWAQNYTAATTWQLKHQVAFWKSRAVALQYENKVLHELIREQHFKQPNLSVDIASDSSECSEESQYDENENAEVEEYAEEVDEDNDNFEVSEEFIEFLKQNAKYKEDARRERELLRAKQTADLFEAHAREQTFESPEEKEARLMELYGDNWEKIVALETSMLCNFISECDKDQPEYWPNIPFNFSC